MRARLRTSAPLVALVALLALLLMPHQSGPHAGPPPGAAAGGTASAVLGHAAAAVAGSAAVVGSAVTAVAADVVAGLPAAPARSEALLLALGCAVMMVALGLLPRPGPRRALAGAACRPVPGRVRAPRARSTGPPRDLLVEICVCRT